VARVFTREQFYELVWSKPMTHLAKEFAISDVALHKICKKHDIPNPPLGWWAKKAAGKSVAQAPLEKSNLDHSSKIIIADGDLSRESAVVKRIRDDARVLASEGGNTQADLTHPIIERTIAWIKKAQPSERGIVATEGAGLIRCEIGLDSIDRVAIALPRIVQAASLQGFELVAEDGFAKFKSDTESVDFSITETVKRQKHVLTASEIEEQEAWERKRDRESRQNRWIDIFAEMPGLPDFDYTPTGQLSFEFEHIYFWSGSSPRRSFKDAKVQRLEAMAVDIAVGLAVFASAKTAERLKREKEQHGIEEDRIRRELAARAKHIEDRRIAGLDSILGELAEMDRLQSLMARLSEEAGATLGPRLAAFMAWSEERIAKHEARLSTKGLEARFESVRLFGDDDDHDYTSTKLWQSSWR